MNYVRRGKDTKIFIIPDYLFLYEQKSIYLLQIFRFMVKSYFKDHPVQSGLVVGLILLFISSTGIVAWLQNIVWWEAIKNVVSTVWNAIVWFMTIDIPIWGILIFVVGLILILYIANIIYNATHSQSGYEQQTLDWLNYTSDTFDGFQYEWKYTGIDHEQCSIRDITVLCPNCGTSLLPTNRYNDSFRCPRCNKYFDRTVHNAPKSLGDIEVLIIDNIKRGNYKH